MRSSRRVTPLPLVLLVLARPLFAQELPRVRPEAVGMSSARLERLTAVFRRYVAEERLPGGVILVARQGGIPYFEAFGARDREAGAPMPRDAIFRIASQTKAIVSVAVMILQEEGALLITDPVGKYLPEFREATVAVPHDDDRGYDDVAAERAITIRDLLTHTAGIGYGYGVACDRWAEAGIQGWYFADRNEPIGATVARMAALPFDAQPGQRFIYGYSTDILGALIERVSGMPLNEFLRTRILDPLKMRDTHFYLPPSERERLAVVYSAAEGGGLERAPTPGGMVGQGAYVGRRIPLDVLGRPARGAGRRLLHAAHPRARRRRPREAARAGVPGDRGWRAPHGSSTVSARSP